MVVAAKNTAAAIESWTGDRYEGCAWRALFNEYVGRVLAMYPAWQKHQLAIAFPRLTYREMQGVLHYDRVLSKIDARRQREQLAELERKRKAGAQ